MRRLLLSFLFTKALKPENFQYSEHRAVFGLVQGKRRGIKDVGPKQVPAPKLAAGITSQRGAAKTRSLPDNFGRKQPWVNTSGGKIVVMSRDAGGSDFGCSETQAGGSGACQLRCSDAKCTNAETLCRAKSGCVAVGLNADFSWGTLKKQSASKPVDVNAYIRSKGTCELGGFAPGVFEQSLQQEQAASAYCGMRADELRGWWSRDGDKPPKYAVEGCRLHRFTAEEARSCLKKQHVMFAGDSTTRYTGEYCSGGFALPPPPPPPPPLPPPTTPHPPTPRPPPHFSCATFSSYFSPHDLYCTVYCTVTMQVSVLVDGVLPRAWEVGHERTEGFDLLGEVMGKWLDGLLQWDPRTPAGP
jgi:hypothetical protein